MWSALIPSGWTITLLGIVVAPLIGMSCAFVLMFVVVWTFHKWNPRTLDRYFRRFQLFSAAIYSFAHGTNDAQKTMGIIAGALFAGGYQSPSTFRSGSLYPRTLPSRWGRSRADGGS